MRTQKQLPDVSSVLLALALGVTAACGGDDGSSGTSIGAPATESPESTGQSAAGPRYAVITQVISGEQQQTSFISVTDSLNDPAPLSLAGAREVPGRAIAVGEPGSGVMYVGSNQGPEITRYSLDAEGNLVPGPTVTFVQNGVAGIGEYAGQIQLVSPTKAYYFDARSAQVIVWNPTTMTVTSAIDLRELTLQGSVLSFSQTPLRQGDKIVVPVGWRSPDGLSANKRAGAVVVDTASDTARVLIDERCGYVRDGAIAADGRVYLATEAFGSAANRVNPAATAAPCLLRLTPDLSAYDASFFVELNALAQGVTGSLVQIPSGKVYTRVLDEASAGITPMTAPRVLASVPAWGWAEVSLGDSPSATRLADAPLGTGSMITFETEDRMVLAEIARTDTKLRELTGGPGEVVLTTPGLTFAVVQLR